MSRSSWRVRAMRVSMADARASLDQRPVGVGHRAARSEQTDLLVAKPADLEDEVAALASRQRRHDVQGFERLERILERAWVGGDFAPVAS